MHVNLTLFFVRIQDYDNRKGKKNPDKICMLESRIKAFYRGHANNILKYLSAMGHFRNFNKTNERLFYTFRLLLF